MLSIIYCGDEIKEYQFRSKHKKAWDDHASISSTLELSNSVIKQVLRDHQ